MPDGRSARPPRRSGGRPGTSRRPAGSRRPGRGRPPETRNALTAAQLRAREVAAKRGPRKEIDRDDERRKIEERSVAEWVDEGASEVRTEAAEAAARASARPRRPRPQRSVAPDVVAEIAAQAPDRRRADRLAQQLADAEAALDGDRLDDARRAIIPLVRDLPGVAAVREVAGLVQYRRGRWREAVRELEAARALRPNVELLPVLADGYRALKRWGDVERVWSEVRELSPSHEVIAEARIVAAGAQADRGDLAGALRTMARVASRPKRVRDHHLRQWYVLGDLHDRAGDPLEAARWFERITAVAPDFVDVRQRLRALGH